MQQIRAHLLLLLLACTILTLSSAFVTPSSSVISSRQPPTTPKGNNNIVTSLFALDPVTYLRTEWVSAALCTNQTPRSADIVLQLGSEDGRAINFVPRTVREFITSSAEKSDGPESGGLTVTCERQLKQMAERRQSAKVTYSNQPSDDLKDTLSSSVDIVISLQAAQRMHENGLDWKRSIYEAGRVLKPGGRLLFVEASEVGGESYLDYVTQLSEFRAGGRGDGYEEIQSATESNVEDGKSKEVKASPIFDEVGYDQVDMVLQPHIAGVAIKALDADLTAVEKAQKASEEERDRLAELSLNAFERGNKSRRRRKKKKKKDKADSNTTTP